MNARDMQGRIHRFLLSALVLVFGLFPSGAAASTYDSILAFGDSLSANKGTNDEYDGKWTNGKVWVEYLAERLGVGLTDVAAEGTTTSTLLSQADNYGTISSSTLVTIWAGGADLPYLLGTGFPGTSYATAAGNLNSAILALIGKGARNFVIPNLLNISVIPNVSSPDAEYSQDLDKVNFVFPYGITTAVDYAAWWCQGFNQKLSDYLIALQLSCPKYHFYTYDTYAMLTGMVADPGTFGFSDKDAIFYEGFHPSSQTHAYLADRVYSQVVPLPASLLFFGSGLLGLIGIRRRIKG